jgi:hypothetical protein
LTKKNQEPLFDILLIASTPEQRIGDEAVASMIRNIAVERFAVPYAEALAKDWCQVYSEPSVSSHGLFIEGSYSHEEPPFLEMVVHFANKLEKMPFGSEEEAYFYLAIYGARFDTLIGSFAKRIEDILYLHPVMHLQKHQSVPAHREVPEGEERKDPKRLKRDRQAPSVGSRVEEW